MDLHHVGADRRSHDRVVRVVVELHDAARDRSRVLLHTGVELRGRQNLVEETLGIAGRLALLGILADAIEQFLGVG